MNWKESVSHVTDCYSKKALYPSGTLSRMAMSNLAVSGHRRCSPSWISPGSFVMSWPVWGLFVSDSCWNTVCNENQCNDRICSFGMNFYVNRSAWPCVKHRGWIMFASWKRKRAFKPCSAVTVCSVTHFKARRATSMLDSPRRCGFDDGNTSLLCRSLNPNRISFSPRDRIV